MLNLKILQDYSIRHWLNKGLWRNKTVFGIPTYGRGYTLLSKYFHFVYAPAVGFSAIGETYSFAQVSLYIQNNEKGEDFE